MTTTPRSVKIPTDDGYVEVAPYGGQWFLTIERADGTVAGQCLLTHNQAVALVGRAETTPDDGGESS